MIYSIQYMRAIAAFMVVLHHATWKGAQYSSDPFSWFYIGGAGVDLFFIISGFIMCNSVDSKDVRPHEFIRARIFRIIPLYWVLTTIALVVFWFSPEKINSSGGSTSLIHSYTLFPIKDKYLIQNGWTLSYEFFFYFLFVSSFLIKSSLKYILPCGLILGLVLLGFIFPGENYLFRFITDPLLIEFVFGIGVFYLFRKITPSYKMGIILILLSILLFTAVNIYQFDSSRVYSFGLPALIFFMGMLSLEKVFRRFKGNILLKLLKSLGDSSYSLYLFNPFSLVVCSMLLTSLGVNRYGYLFVAIIVVCSIISSHLCYVLLERPLAKYIENRVQSKSYVYSPFKRT